jgi:uncharacterized protein (TIGR02444 family)
MGRAPASEEWDLPRRGWTVAMPDRTSLWNFSLTFYARPGVAGLCLDLQDRFAADVNVLLYLLWQASRRRRLDASEMGQVAALAGDWRQNVVLPLRGVRRFLKEPAPSWPAAGVHALRERIKADELQAERLQQETMERQFAGLGAPAEIMTAAHANCEGYAHLLAVRFPQQHIASLVTRLTGDV